MTVGTLWAFLRMNNDDFNNGLNSAMKNVAKFAALAMATSGGVGAAFAVIGTAIAGSIAGAAVGLVGLGVLSAAFRDDVKKSFSDLGAHVGSTMKSISAPFAQVLIGWSGELKRQFDTIAPLLESTFKTLAPFLKRQGDALIRPISEGFQKLVPALSQIFQMITPGVEALGPKIEKAFGKIADNIVPVFQSLLPVVKSFFSGIGTVVEGLVGFFKNLNAAVGNGTTQWTQLTSILGMLLPVVGSLVGALALIGGALLKDLTGPLQALMPVISAVATFIGKHATEIAKAIEVFAILWAANWIRMRIVAMANAIQMAAAWFIALGPIGWIIAAVIALVAIIIVNWDTVKEWTIKIWGYVADFCVMIWNHIVSYAVTAFNAFVSFWVFLWNTVKDFFVGVWNAVYDFCAMVLGKIRDFFVSAWNAIWTVISTVLNIIWTGIQMYFNLYKTIIETVLNIIVTVVTTVWDAIKTAFNVALDFIVMLVTTYFNMYKTIIMTVFDAIKTVITTALDFIKLVITTAWDFIKTATSTAWGFIKTIIDTFITGIKLAIDGMKTAVTTTVTAVVTVITGIKDTVVGFFLGAGEWLKEAGRKIIQGLIDGVTSMVGAVKDAVGGVVSAARNLLPFSPAKEGPFSGKGWTLYSGQSMMEGLAKGILSQSGAVNSAINSVLDGASTSMNNGSLGLPTGIATPMGRVSATAPMYLTFTGPVYSDSSGVKRLISQLEPAMRQKFSNAGKNNAGQLY